MLFPRMMFVFLRKLLFKKLFSFKVIYFVCDTEETQISIFPIYNKETKYIIDRVSVIPLYFA